MPRVAPNTGWLAGACCWMSLQPALAGPGDLLLHVPSPDWRDQVIYFLMIDRFNDGDPDNNDQGAGEYDPSDPARFSGGDLRGITERIDYIRGLGATTVWITPPVANQWWQPAANFSGYHGYWAENFMEVDAHFGTLLDYQRLSDALHREQMYLVQDIVVNHTANYFQCAEPAAPDESCVGYRRLPDSRGRSAPTQSPFDRNDPRKRSHRRSAAYHWTPDVRDYTDPQQELNYQMSGLDDLDTENPAVRRALRASYGHWINTVGVDGYRVDTAFYVPADYFTDLRFAADRQAPGIDRMAARTGRTGFHLFGEGFAIDRPYEDHASRRIAAYSGPDKLPGMLNFPLYGSLLDVYARGQPTAVLAHRIEQAHRLFGTPQLWPSFVDNHDVDRYLAGGDEAGLRLSLLSIFTLPGIPTIYYGTEQGFTRPRQAMFAAGVESGGMDHFDSTAPLYTYIASLARLRREFPVLSRGEPQILHANAAGPGALVYRMRQAEASADTAVDTDTDTQALVLLNSANHPVLIDQLDGLERNAHAGRDWQLRLQVGPDPSTGRDSTERRHLNDPSSVLPIVLPPRSAQVWTAAARLHERAAPSSLPRSVRLDPLIEDAVAGGELKITGQAPAGSTLRIVVDGDLGAAQTVVSAADGRYAARIDTRAMLDPDLIHRVVVYDPSQAAVSVAQTFKVQQDWLLLTEVLDPAGDDHGRNGRYVYPLDASWRDHRQADIRAVRVYGSGGALRIEVELASLTRLWNPANGFDHMALTLFLGLPGRTDGSTVMPQQSGALPERMRWQLRLRSHGWSNALFGFAGADALHEGTPLSPGAMLEADQASRTLRYTFPASALGTDTELSGLKLYLNTWDYDGGYRALARVAGPHSFGGGAPGAPKVMDESVVIELP